MSTYQSVDEIRQKAEDKIRDSFNGLWDEARIVWQIAILRRLIRLIEVKSRQIESAEVRAGYLGSLEMIKLLASTVDSRGLEDLACDIITAKGLMQRVITKGPPVEIAKINKTKRSRPEGRWGGRHGVRPWTDEENNVLNRLSLGERQTDLIRELNWPSCKMTNLVKKAKRIKDSRIWKEAAE